MKLRVGGIAVFVAAVSSLAASRCSSLNVTTQRLVRCQLSALSFQRSSLCALSSKLKAVSAESRKLKAESPLGLR